MYIWMMNHSSDRHFDFISGVKHQNREINRFSLQRMRDLALFEQISTLEPTQNSLGKVGLALHHLSNKLAGRKRTA
jgi:hypothetical protein